MASDGILHDLTPYFAFVLLLSTIGPLLFGFHLAELNAPQDVITCAKKSISATVWSRVSSHFTQQAAVDGLPQCIKMNSAQLGLVSSFFTLGGLTGALLAGPTTARLGRLRTMLYNASFFMVGPVLEALAPNIATLVVGRAISGIGAGASVVVVPLWISETSPPKAKGFFGAFTQIMVNVGILIAQVLGYFLSKGQLWRIILGAGGVIGLVQALGLLFAGQESPKWLAENGKPSQAKRVLRRLRGHNVDIEAEVTGWGTNEEEEDVEDEEEALLHSDDRGAADSSARRDSRPEHYDGTGEAMQDIAHQTKQSANEIRKEVFGTFTIFKDPHSRRAIGVVMMIMVAQQLCGINSIVMYGVSLLADLLAANSAFLNIMVAVLNIIVTTAAAPLVDKIGRKPCLLISIAGMGTNSILLGIGILKAIPALSAVAVLLFVASFGLGLGPVPFILSSELVGPEAVAATQSWALAANWIATFAVAQFFPILSETLGKGQVYFLFASFALIFGLLTAWLVPETMGKASADEVWGRGKPQARED
jgi:MFS family permease